ncbi:MAG: YkgJ family cysteine cluster protein [Lachnospiraceae bacterium]|nr:YkgJ family cysteine cluster protein [Lachnospiraceae bacterium]
MSVNNQFYASYKNVKIGCHDCKGCSACCRDMGDSIIMDPFDFYRIETGLSYSPADILGQYAELKIHEGLILPNLKMVKVDDHVEQCRFLNEEGRCSIHIYRPGLCRLFPLGRNYEDGIMTYFILEDACHAKGERTKVKISEWIDIEDMERYERFLTDWHYYLKDVRTKITALPQDEWESGMKTASMNILQTFYLLPYDTKKNFYGQFYERLL